MTYSKYLLPFVLVSSAFSGSGHAIVSMEDLHTGSPEEGVSGKVVLSMSASDGTVEKEDYSLGTRVQWHKEKITNYLLLNGAYGKVDGVKNTEKTFLHARHIYQLKPTLAAEGYIQQDTNKFARIDYRRLYGAGLRFTLYEQEQSGNAYFGLGSYYSQQKITDGFDDAGKDSEWRASTYLILKYQATENTVLASTTYYQPSFDDSSDYRALQQAAMRVRLSDTLALIISADVRIDSRPPEGVEKREATYVTSLSYEF